MKKLISFIALTLILFSVLGCSNNNEPHSVGDDSIDEISGDWRSGNIYLLIDNDNSFIMSDPTNKIYGGGTVFTYEENSMILFTFGPATNQASIKNTKVSEDKITGTFSFGFISDEKEVTFERISAEELINAAEGLEKDPDAISLDVSIDENVLKTLTDSLN